MGEAIDAYAKELRLSKEIELQRGLALSMRASQRKSERRERRGERCAWRARDA